MQVKKYEATSVIEALKEVKNDLGPDAIILSTQEAKNRVGGAKKFIVVAAVSEQQLAKKKLAEKQMGNTFETKVSEQSASRQKMFIESVYRGAEKKHEARQRKITSTPYIDIADGEEIKSAVVENKPANSTTRVKAAAQAAFKSSLSSQFFKEEKQVEELLPDNILQTLTKKPKIENASLTHMTGRLKKCGVLPELIEQMTLEAERELGQGIARKAMVDSWFAKRILNMTTVNNSTESSDIEFFVGAEGSGKTSTLVKMATHYVMNEQKSVAIITTDLNKVGAVEQLRVYSRILNVPVQAVRMLGDLNRVIDQYSDYDKILIDTPGISLSNMEELDFMRSIAHFESTRKHSVHFVVSALTKESDLGGLLKRFRVAKIDDIIVTNIDQTSQHGILVNIQSKVNIPFHSFGIGSDVVDGFEMASRERVLDLLFKLTKQIGERAHDSSL